MCLQLHDQSGPESASLDSPETTAPLLAAATIPQLGCHSEYCSEWLRVQQALASSSEPRLRKRAERINGCCVAPMLLLTAKGKLAASPGYCRDRMCPTCQQRRARVVAARCSSLTVGMDSPRFLTLTLKAMDRPLFLTIAALTASFRVLRDSTEWRRHVSGGVYVIEVTRNDSTKLWHAHIHVIFDGRFWAQRDISRVWLRVTGDSPVVDVRAVHSRTSAANYVAKYVAKPTGSVTWPANALCEYADAMHGRRMVHTFGASYAEEVEPANAGEQKVTAEPLCTANRLIHLGYKNDAYAKYAIELLSRCSYHVRSTLGIKAPLRSTGLPPLNEVEHDRLVHCLRWCRGMMPNDDIAQCCHWDRSDSTAITIAPAQLVICWTPDD